MSIEKIGEEALAKIEALYADVKTWAVHEIDHLAALIHPHTSSADKPVDTMQEPAAATTADVVQEPATEHSTVQEPATADPVQLPAKAEPTQSPA